MSNLYENNPGQQPELPGLFSALPKEVLEALKTGQVVVMMVAESAPEIDRDFDEEMIARAMSAGNQPLIRPEDTPHVYSLTKAIGSLCYEKNIKDLVLVDRAARPINTALSTYWNLAYPGEQRPRTHFINPGLPRLAVEGSFSQRRAANRDFAGDLRATRSPLADRGKSDDAVLVFDTCVHWGSTLESVKEALIKQGRKDVSTGVITTDPQDGYKPKIDYSLASDSTIHGCHPFGLDRSIKRLSSAAHSERNTQEWVYAGGILRREIRRLVELGFSSDPSQKTGS